MLTDQTVRVAKNISVTKWTASNQTWKRRIHEFCPPKSQTLGIRMITLYYGTRDGEDFYRQELSVSA